MSVKEISSLRLSAFAIFATVFLILGNASAASAQDGNMYEEPWHPAARFAVKEAGKRDGATITLVRISNANLQTGETGLDFKICMEVTFKKGRKKAVRRYALTDVFRNDQTMDYTLKSWALSKRPPDFCK